MKEALQVTPELQPSVTRTKKPFAVETGGSERSDIYKPLNSTIEGSK